MALPVLRVPGQEREPVRVQEPGLVQEPVQGQEPGRAPEPVPGLVQEPELELGQE